MVSRRTQFREMARAAQVFNNPNSASMLPRNGFNSGQYPAVRGMATVAPSRNFLPQPLMNMPPNQPWNPAIAANMNGGPMRPMSMMAPQGYLTPQIMTASQIDAHMRQYGLTMNGPLEAMGLTTVFPAMPEYSRLNDLLARYRSHANLTYSGHHARSQMSRKRREIRDTMKHFNQEYQRVLAMESQGVTNQPRMSRSARRASKRMPLLSEAGGYQTPLAPVYAGTTAGPRRYARGMI